MEHRIPIELETVSRCAEHFGAPDTFSDVNVIFAQHFLGDLVAFARTMQSLGLRKELGWFIDIPYASNSIVRQKLRELGFPQGNFAPAIDLSPLESYQPTQFFRASNLFENAISEGIKYGARRTIIIDDGGHSTMARFAINKVARPSAHPVVVVEQTGYGMKLHRQVALPALAILINIAESPAKLEYESPVIARTILRKTQNLLSETQLPFNSTDTFAIFGYGSIGKAVVKTLVEEHQLPEEQLIVKPDPKEAFYSLKQGRLSDRVDLDALLQLNVRVVIGCTGERAFLNSHLPLLSSEALLISASSGTMEFPRNEWIAAAENSHAGHISLSEINRLRDSKDIHQILQFELNGKTVLLANSGYPLNFEGEVNSSPPEAMQLTVALMLTGAIRAVGTTQHLRGELKLDRSDEQWITDTYIHSLRSAKSVKYAQQEGDIG